MPNWNCSPQFITNDGKCQVYCFQMTKLTNLSTPQKLASSNSFCIEGIRVLHDLI